MSKENNQRRTDQKKQPQRTLKEKRLERKANANGGSAAHSMSSASATKP